MSTPFITTGQPSNVKEIKGPSGIAFKEIIPKLPVGRPSTVTPAVLAKLDIAFRYAFTDKEAALYAGISPDALWRYQEQNPDFRERKEQLRLTPNLKAKEVLVAGIDGSVEQARWWAANKMNDEFAPKSKTEHSGKVETVPTPATPEVLAVVDDFNKKFREAIAAPHKGEKKQ